MSETDQQIHRWQHDILSAFTDAGIGHVSYVPDGGHKGLIQLCERTNGIGTTALTSEEEGIPLSAGLWLGGVKSALLMQSSGVGNCINMLSMAESCRFPLVVLITMRGEWGEFVPWQIPMGSRVAPVLGIMAVDTYRCESAEDVAPTVRAALDHAYFSDRSVAVILAQRLIGAKNWGTR
ncbi:MAG: phosphonopyruvate decarboxylase [Pseudomonadota bacterium]